MTTCLCFRCPHKWVFLQDLNKSHLSLHEGKPHPNAVTRAPAKGDVAKSRPLCLLLRSEPEEVGKDEGRARGRGRKRGWYLSGSNFSGSGQISGLSWMSLMGSWTVTPLGMVTPLISMVFWAKREVLQQTHHPYVSQVLSLCLQYEHWPKGVAQTMLNMEVSY